MSEQKSKNVNVSVERSEIKIGDTVYIITCNYGTADLEDIIVDYLAEKQSKCS